MSANLGELEAERILKARQTDATRAAQQAQSDRILQSEQPRFFAAMAEHLKEIVESFNRSMALEGEDAVTFQATDHEIYLGKRGMPFLHRKVMHFEQSNELIVRTQIINGYQKQLTEPRWYFDVKNGVLRLNFKNFVECAEELFKGIPDLYR
jgi:hypothetical protein